MEQAIHAVAIAIKIGFFGVVGFIGAVYVFASLESHCWNPVGCTPSAQYLAEAEENDAALRCNSRWRECLGNAYVEGNLPEPHK